MTIHAVPKSNLQRDSSSRQIRRDVRKAIVSLARAEKVRLKKSDIPKIITSTSGGASYDGKERTITIPLNEKGDGIAYFEEASHALRDISLRRKGIPYEKQDRQVHEFYGRIGETLGRHLTEGTPAHQFFADIPPRDNNNPAQKEALLKRLLKIRSLKAQNRAYKKDLAQGRESIRSSISQNYSGLLDAFNSYDRGATSYTQLHERIAKLAGDLSEKLEDIRKGTNGRLSKTDIGEVNLFTAAYGFIQRMSSKVGSNESTRKQVMKMIAKDIKEEYNPDGFLKLDLPDVEHVTADSIATVEHAQHVFHRKPYLYAQQYSPDELLKERGLYGLSDQEVRKRFFHRRRSSLEKTVDAAIFVGIIFSIITSFSAKTIQLSPPAMLFYPLKFLILPVALCAMWIGIKAYNWYVFLLT